MSRFAILTPYFIVVVALIIAVLGGTSLVRMPVDMFPNINIPVVVVATFYNGMPPEQIESDITSRFERQFTLASGIEHIESRSLPGASVIRVYFQPGTNADSAVATISNLAMAQLRRLPPGTLPPVVLKFDASSLPVCLVTVGGRRLQRNAIARSGAVQRSQSDGQRPGASVPQPFGGGYRQIMVYADPYKLEAHQLSLMDVVRTVNRSNLILPAGDVPIGPLDYNIYTNSQLPSYRGNRPAAAQGRRADRSCACRTSAMQKTPSRSKPASFAWTANVGLHAGAQAGRRHKHDRSRGRCAGR